MARGQRIAFSIAVIIGMGICIALGLGKFSPKPEMVTSTEIPNLELQDPGSGIFPTNELVISRVVTIPACDLDPATIHDPTRAGDRFLDLLDMTTPVPEVRKD
jgi:hypothetical protein